ALLVANLSRVAPQAAGVTVFQGPTVTATGTQISAPNAALGSTAVGQNVAGTYAARGAERVLKPNTTYLLRVINNDTASCKIAVWATWYEGTPDLPLSIVA
ncbi:MAG: hypothetical protein ACRC8G_03285, partial [Plesiomonas shigelloides]